VRFASNRPLPHAPPEASRREPTIAHELLHFRATAAWRDAGKGRYRSSHDNEFWWAGITTLSPHLHVDLDRVKRPWQHWPRQGWDAAQQKQLEAALAARQLPW
jgi:hypothetical protein